MLNYGHINDIDCIVDYRCMNCGTGKRAQTVDTKEIDLPCEGSLQTALSWIGVHLSPITNQTDEKKSKKLYNKQTKQVKKL